jgi:hypothetical protein
LFFKEQNMKRKGMSIIKPVLATGKAKGKTIVPVPLDEQIYNWLESHWDQKWEDVEKKLVHQIDIWLAPRRIGKNARNSGSEVPTSPVPRDSPVISTPESSVEPVPLVTPIPINPVPINPVPINPIPVPSTETTFVRELPIAIPVPVPDSVPITIVPPVVYPTYIASPPIIPSLQN